MKILGRSLLNVSLLRDGMVHCEEIGTISSVNVGQTSPDNCVISLISSCMCDVFLGFINTGKTTDFLFLFFWCANCNLSSVSAQREM